MNERILLYRIEVQLFILEIRRVKGKIFYTTLTSGCVLLDLKDDFQGDPRRLRVKNPDPNIKNFGISPELGFPIQDR